MLIQNESTTLIRSFNDIDQHHWRSMWNTETEQILNSTNFIPSHAHAHTLKKQILSMQRAPKTRKCLWAACPQLIWRKPEPTQANINFHCARNLFGRGSEVALDQNWPRGNRSTARCPACPRIPGGHVRRPEFCMISRRGVDGTEPRKKHPPNPLRSIASWLGWTFSGNRLPAAEVRAAFPGTEFATALHASPVAVQVAAASARLCTPGLWSMRLWRGQVTSSTRPTGAMHSIHFSSVAPFVGGSDVSPIASLPKLPSQEVRHQRRVHWTRHLRHWLHRKNTLSWCNWRPMHLVSERLSRWH